MTDRTEEKIESLRGEISSLASSLTRLEALVEFTTEAAKEDRRKAQEDRSQIWVEIRGIGNKLIDAGNEIKGMRRDVSEMAPTVRVLEHERLQVMGAGKAAIIMTKVLWAIGGAVAGGAAAVLTWAGLIKPH